jgi:hypothetical protein
MTIRVKNRMANEEYPEQEAQRRFRGSLKAALNMPPKPQKKIIRKGVPAQSKKKKKAKG